MKFEWDAGIKLVRNLFMLISLCFIFSACLIKQQVITTITPISVQPSRINTQKPTQTATVRPTRTRLPTYTPTATLTITPTLAPISQAGPWLFLSEGTTWTGQWSFISPIISNWDGSAWEAVNLPRDPSLPEGESEAWFGAISPKSPYVAASDILSEYQPVCKETDEENYFYDTKNDYIYILKLPENKIVGEFLRFGEAAIEQIQKEECDIVKQKRYDTPPVRGVVQNVASMWWSPDGRYLAFPAAPEGSAADLYLFDTQTQSFRRLTTRLNNPHILGWAPDGETIIYEGITKMDVFHIQYQESSGLFAVSVNGSDKVLLETGSVSSNLQWLSQTQFLITEGSCAIEGCNVNLRLFDLASVSFVQPASKVL